MAFMFEKLEVYQKSLNLAEEVTAYTDKFSTVHYYLSYQLSRAVLSISANLAEGNGRWHAKERKQFFWISRGSAHECLPILELCKRKNLIPVEKHERLKNEIEIIVKMISGLINGMDKK